MPLFALLLAADASSSPFESLRKGEALLAAHEEKELVRFIKSIGSNKNTWDISIYLIIKNQIAIARSDAAKETYESEKIKFDKTEIFQTRLINSYCLLYLGQHDKAEQLADELGRSGKGTERARAGEVMADVRFEKKEWQDAVEWIGKSLSLIVTDYPNDEDTAYREYLIKKQRRYQEVLDLNLHGLGFYLYKTAQTERIENGSPQKAKQIFDKLILLAKENKGNPITSVTGIDDPNLYKQPIPSAYEEAAYFYTAISSQEMGKRAESTSMLMALRARDKFGPYCGEALRILGDNALAIDKDPKGAQIFYKDCVGWFIAFQTAPIDKAKFIPPDQSREITKGANAMKSTKGWNDIQWFKQEPRQIYNSLTCTWYNDYQLLKYKYKLSFVQFLLGKTDDAVETLKETLKYDSLDAQLTASATPSNYLRLRDEYKAGRMYANQEETALFKNSPINVDFFLAELALETEQWDEARKSYGNLLDLPRLSKNQIAYLTYAIAVIETFQGNNKEALQKLALFDKELAETISWPRAQILKSDLIPNGVDRFKLLSQISLKYANTDAGLNALQRLGMNQLAFRDLNAAEKTFQQLKTKSKPDSHFYQTAEAFLAAIIFERKQP